MKKEIKKLLFVIALISIVVGTIITIMAYPENEPKLYCGYLSMFEYPNSWGNSGYVLYFEDRMFFVIKSKVIDLNIEKDYEKMDCCIEYTIVKDGIYGNAYYIELLDIKKVNGNG